MSSKGVGQQRGKRNANNSNTRQRAGTARRSLLPVLEVPKSSLYQDLGALDVLPGPDSPTSVLPVDAATRQQIVDSIDDFVLQLPLGTDAAAAQVEAAVSAKLLSLYLANKQLKQRLTKWTSVAQELQELVQQQQQELEDARQQLQQLRLAQQHKLQQKVQALPRGTAAAAPVDASTVVVAEAANSELRRQLQGATSRLQEVEAAMKQLLDQQSRGSDLQSSQLLAERDAANAALAEASKAAATAQQDAGRLRHALLDAEIDTQRASVAADTAQRKVKELEAELQRARCQIDAAKNETAAEHRKVTAAEAAAAASHAQLLEAQAAASRAQLEASKAQQDAEHRLATVQLQCDGCAEKAGKILALQEELQSLTSSRATLELAMQDEQKYSKERDRRLEECRMDLERARMCLTQAEQQRDELYGQPYGSAGTAAAAILGPASVDEETYPLLGWSANGGSPQKAGACAGGYPSPVPAPRSSPNHLQLLQQRPQPNEGLVQRCSQLEVQLQQQDIQLQSFRDQLLELQLQLSDAQSAACMAQGQLQDSRSKLAAAETAAAAASTAAAAAAQECQQQKQQLLQLQQQSSELTAARSQLEKLEAQQRVLLGDLKESMSATVAASSAQASAETKAEGLQVQLQEVRAQQTSAEKAWQQERDRLAQEAAQLSNKLSAAESAAQKTLQQAEASHRRQLEQLTAGHSVRIDALRAELAADAGRRTETEARIQAIQRQNAEQLAAANADLQQQLSQQQALNQTVTSQQAELTAAAQKLTAAEAALAAARSEAAAQSTAAVKEQERLRQQLLEVRGERLQLQEQLSVLQRSLGSNQQLAEQLAAVQADAAAVAVGLRQQLADQQQHVQELQKQIRELQQEKVGLEAKLAEARAGRETAAKQAAAAGERLAAAVATQETLRQQLEAAGLQPGRYPSPSSSPYRAANSSRTITQLTQQLAEAEAQLAAVTAELDQSQQDNLALVHELQRLQRVMQDDRLSRIYDSRAAQTSPVRSPNNTTLGSLASYGEASRNNSQVPRLQSLLEELETLQQRVADQAAVLHRCCMSSPNRDCGQRYPADGLGGADGSRGQLVTAAAAVAEVSRGLTWLNRELRALLQQQQQPGEFYRTGPGTQDTDDQQLQALRLLVQQLRGDLADREAQLAELPTLQRQLATLQQQLRLQETQEAEISKLQNELADMSQLLAATTSATRDVDVADLQRQLVDRDADVAELRHQITDRDADVADLQRQLAELQAQLATARSAADANTSTAEALHKLMSEMTDIKRQLDDARQQGDDAKAAATAAAAAEAAEAAAAAAAEAERMQGLVRELQVQLDGAHVAAAVAVSDKERAAAELQQWQRRSEEVTDALQQNQQQLEVQHTQVAQLQEQLFTTQAASVKAQAEGQQLQQQLAQAQTREAAVRSQLAIAQQLEAEVKQLRGQLEQQQKQQEAYEPTSTARKMQALLVQKDKDIQRLQQLLQDQQLQKQQLDQEQRQQEGGMQQYAAAETAGDDAAADTAAAVVAWGAEDAASGAAAARQQQQQDYESESAAPGLLDPSHLERSLRPTNSSSRSTSRSSSRGRSEVPADSSSRDASSRALSMAASRVQSLGGTDLLSPSIPASFSAAGISSAAGSDSAAGSGPAHHLREQPCLRTSSSFGAVAISTAAGSRWSSNEAGAAADSRLVNELLALQPVLPDNSLQQRLEKSPSKRAAAAAAAIGDAIAARELTRLPVSTDSSSNSAVVAGSVEPRVAIAAGSRLASFNKRLAGNNDSTAEAAALDAENISAGRLSRSESARGLSKQSSSSRAAQLAAAMTAGANISIRERGESATAAVLSSSDEESDSGVGILGGLSRNISSSSRRVSADTSTRQHSGVRVHQQGRVVKKSSSARLSGADPEPAGVGSLSSGVGSNIRQSLSSSSSERRGLGLSLSVSGASRSSDSSSGSSSRARLLAESLGSGGGYDADKLQRSLSAGRRTEQQQQQAGGPLTASSRARHVSANGALEDVSRIGPAALKSAMSTGRAARVAGVMRSVSFQEPARQ